MKQPNPGPLIVAKIDHIPLSKGSGSIEARLIRGSHVVGRVLAIPLSKGSGSIEADKIAAIGRETLIGIPLSKGSGSIEACATGPYSHGRKVHSALERERLH